MPRNPEHNHLVAKLKSFPAWKQGMTLKKRVAQRNEEGEYERDEDGKIVYEVERVPVPAEKRSLMNHKHMSANVQKHYGVLWNQADKCPLFRQEIVRKADENNRLPAYKIDSEGAQITTRANRALSGHTLKTLASGAVGAVNAQLHSDAKILRLDPNHNEDSKYPMLPSISLGATFGIEAAWIAYSQEIFSAAVEIQKAHKKKHTKVTAKCCQAAAEIVNKKMSAGTAFVPVAVAFRKPIKKKRLKEQGDAKATKAK